jgi:hypothetical protein
MADTKRKILGLGEQGRKLRAGTQFCAKQRESGGGTRRLTRRRRRKRTFIKSDGRPQKRECEKSRRP